LGSVGKGIQTFRKFHSKHARAGHAAHDKDKYKWRHLIENFFWFILAFAEACAVASAYGFLQGAWPFGVVEAVWTIIALRRWQLRRRAPPKPFDMRRSTRTGCATAWRALTLRLSSLFARGVADEGQAIDASHKSIEARDVVAMARQQHEADQIAERIYDGRDLRRPTAARFANGLFLSPPFAPVP
jgi:hypothetical protein